MSKTAPSTWAKVFAEEIEVVKKRHTFEGKPEENLVGLAFSGGGIRSATFGLGVLEALKKFDWLGKIDYLSTVSGGGYIGAWLTANCTQSERHKEPDWVSPAANWKESIDHLRRYSNYLSPVVGFLSADTWSMVAVWIRNTLLVQLIVILAIASALVIPRPLFEFFKYWPAAGNARWTAIFLFILGVVGIAGNQLQSGKKKVAFLQRQSWYKGLGIAALLLAGAIAICLRFDFRPFTGGPVNPGAAAWIALLLVLAGFCLQPVAVQVLNRLWWGDDPPDLINYDQVWVQFAVVLPMMATGFLVAAIMWGESKTSTGFGQWCDYGEFFLYGWRDFPFQLLIVFVSLWVLSFCSIPFHTGKYIAVAFFAPFPATLVLHALLCAIMFLFHSWTNLSAHQAAWRAFVWGPALVLYSFGLTIVILLGILGRQSTEGVREWWSRFGAWLGIYGFAWMLLNVVAAYGPLVGGFLLAANTWKGLSVGGGWIGTTLAGLFAGKSGSTGGKPGKPTSSGMRELVARVAPLVFIAGLFILVSTVLHIAITLNSDLTWTAGQTGAKYWGELSGAKLPVTLWVLVGCVICVALLAARVDINIFGLNAFYRNRLVRCYLGATRFRDKERKPQMFTGFDDDDDLALADLDLKKGPLHIVNCALNLGGSSDLSLHTRHSATFTLTPLSCGTHYPDRNLTGYRQELGYISTNVFGGSDGQPTLGQSISVSGAAASPNMGYHTSPVVAFLLTLFNVRLGWWFPNPQTGAASPSPWFSFHYLVKELFGGADDKSEFLAISDGGHFENLAAYELVKRKCRVIIISDGECDPDLRFEGLATLIRMCEVDFGARITIDVGSIRPQGDSLWSAHRCAVGTIDYGPNHAAGKLIYIKASMNGHEDTPILQYKATHPAFPHESTGDQFYGEDQFETYRSLGREIASQILEPVRNSADFPTLAHKLEKICSPTLNNLEQFTQHSARLMNIWSRLGGNGDLQFLDNQLSGSWPQNPPKDFRSGFYLCSQLIQLMENVYLDLHLEETWDHPDNAGWRNLFMEWANSPALQEAWKMSKPSFGLRFQFFCERYLKLS